MMVFATLTLACIVVVVFAVPVAASATGFVVTDPGMLIGLGIAFLSIGLGTRKLLRHQKRGSSRN